MNNYSVRRMFEEGGFRHHDIKTGKPTTKLLSKNGTWLSSTDANLFFPTKEGLVITEFINGKMTAYAYIIIKDGKFISVPKKPYGTLINVKNELQVPDNILRANIKFLGTGNGTWFLWKALMNSKDITSSEDYIFNTITTSQTRIPNAGMVIYKEGK